LNEAQEIYRIAVALMVNRDGSAIHESLAREIEKIAAR
jgi:hypothetical protein